MTFGYRLAMGAVEINHRQPLAAMADDEVTPEDLGQPVQAGPCHSPARRPVCDRIGSSRSWAVLEDGIVIAWQASARWQAGELEADDAAVVSQYSISAAKFPRPGSWG